MSSTRNQRLERNNAWKGDRAGYHAFHKRVRDHRGMPSKCERCGTDDPTKRYEWANLTGNYQDPDDYQRMCKACHNQFDASRRDPKPIEHGTPAGWLLHRRRGVPVCEPCRLARNDAARGWYRDRAARHAVPGPAPESAAAARSG